MKGETQLLKTVNALRARQNLGQLLEEVFYKGNQFIIQRAGKSMAVVISPEEYGMYLKQREEDMKVFDEISKKNKGVGLKDVETDVNEAIKAVRKNA